MEKYGPSWPGYSWSVHILTISGSTSSSIGRLWAGSTPKPPSSGSVMDRPTPNSSRPRLMMSRAAADSAERAGWLKGGGISRTPWPMRTRSVCWLTAVRNTSGDDDSE